jgi:hypothetical protein
MRGGARSFLNRGRDELHEASGGEHRGLRQRNVGMRSWWKRKVVEKKQVLLLPTVERRRDRIGYLSAVVVVRNEARYLEEWLRFWSPTHERAWLPSPTGPGLTRR